MRYVSDLLGDLWPHHGFRNFWIAQSVNQFGNQISMLAVPLTAILILDATPLQMGILVAALNIPALVFGLFAGVWVDQRRRKPILVGTDLGRAALIGIVPLIAYLGLLRIEQIYVIALLFGTVAMISDIAHRSYLPTLVSNDHLVEGNSKLELSRSAAEIAGPGLAGALIQLLTAPIALVGNAVTYLLSAIFIGRIRDAEPEPEDSEADEPVLRRVRAGIRFVVGSPVLRAIGGSYGTLNFFSVLLEAVLLLYLSQQLGLSPLAIGVIFASGNVGFLVGALGAGRIVRRFGMGRSILGAIALVGLADLLIPLAGGPTVVLISILLLAQFFFGLGLTVYNINQVSLRQSITPSSMLGRMNASMTFLVGIAPAGALIGGVLGELIGLRATLVIAAVGELLAVLWIWFSPVRAMSEYPETLDIASDPAVAN